MSDLEAQLHAHAAREHTEARRVSGGNVCCSWCQDVAQWSLWSSGYPERWLGDACRSHLAIRRGGAARVARIA